jgi:adenylate cyclase
MRKALICIFFLAFTTLSFSQNKQTDSLKALLANGKEDTARVNTLLALSGKLFRIDPEATITYSVEAKELAEKLDYKSGLAYALKTIGMGHYFKGEYVDVLIYWQQSLNTFESI